MVEVFDYKGLFQAMNRVLESFPVLHSGLQPLPYARPRTHKV